MVGEKIKDLLLENEKLRVELEQLKAQGRMSLSGQRSFTGLPADFTIEGLEAMVLLVDEQGAIKYANSPMAKLLGAKDKKAVLKTQLSLWDGESSPLGAGFLSEFASTVRNVGQRCLLEKEFPRFPRNRLAPRAEIQAPLVLRIIGSPVGDSRQVNILIQDVTTFFWLQELFSKCVSSEVLEELQKLPVHHLLRVEIRELTVLFTDLRGFTLVAQNSAPEAIGEMLNSYFARATPCVEKYSGYLNKFLGDGMMVIFGAPLPQKDHALRALICAAEMIQRHREWQQEQKNAGKPSAPVGIGIVTGKMIVGNIGTEKRMEYTALGHPVNLAARLCQAAEGNEILTVPETHSSALQAQKQKPEIEQIPHLSFNPKGKMEFKHIKEPVEIIKVIAKSD